MINLLVDEAYAFDYLSILQIKKNKKSEAYKPWVDCYIYLQNQFDIEKWAEIITSEEYEKIIEANELTFDAVDKAKNDLVTAKHVDYCNYQRYTAKQKFQKRFFNNDLKEHKIGYDKYK